MKQLQNNYTTTEQSMRLLELGVPADSADCYISYNVDKDEEPNDFRRGIRQNEVETDPHFVEHELPCWSVGRLIEIFELCTSSKFERIKTKCSVLTDVLWQIEIHVTEAPRGFCIDFSKLED